MRLLLLRPTVFRDRLTPAGTVIVTAGEEGAALLESGTARSPGVEQPPRGLYDPARQLYNWHPANTRVWRRALARVLSGGTAARINVFGPSTVAGYTTGGRVEAQAWPSYLRRMLAQRYGESGTGVIYFMEPDARVKPGAGWTREPYGPFRASSWGVNGSTDPLTFGPVRATGFQVTYLAGPGMGVLSLNSDQAGQYPTVADCASASWQARTVALPAGPLGDHTLTVRAQAANTGPVNVLAVHGYVGPTSDWTPRGAQVTNVGKGSTVVANLLGNGQDWTGASLGAAVDTNPADLSIVAFAENSPGYQSPEQMKTDYRVLLDRIKASGSDLLLCTSIDWEGEETAFAPQPMYDNAVYELADEYDAPVFDVAARWGRFEDSPPYYSDRIHPTPMGYADIGAGPYSVLHTGI